ncbi:MAG: energy transducer TonB [Candidatus Eremiobacteraeota bacterium]|nr:energy transducer TonB [Candidatus Eremiobacteraeota bacterium]
MSSGDHDVVRKPKEDQRMHPLLTTSLAAAALAGASPATPLAAETSAWTVVRVDVSQRGDLEGMRVAYHSGDTAFDRAALAAVAKTSFTPAWHRRDAATLDYVVARDGRGVHARVLPAVSAPRTVAWTASATN